MQMLHQQRRKALEDIAQRDAAVFLRAGLGDIRFKHPEAGQEGVVAVDVRAHGPRSVEEPFERWE